MPKKGIDQESKSLLIRTLADLKRTDQIEELLNDILSSAEIKDFSRRLMAAKYLSEKRTYMEVINLMGMSPVTINKIYFKTKGSVLIHNLFENKMPQKRGKVSDE